MDSEHGLKTRLLPRCFFFSGGEALGDLTSLNAPSIDTDDEE